MSNYTYSSVFAPHFEDFQRMKDAMGYKASNMHYVLKEFDLFFQKEEVTEPMITKDLVLKWRKGKVNETERTLYDKWSILSQFARYMCHVGFVCYVPRMPKRNFGTYIPYVFTHDQMKGIFEASDEFIMPYSNMSSHLFCIPVLVRLLYSTGIRIGEAVALTNKDIDLQKDTILLRKTKNQQQRIVPISESLKKVLLQYIDYRDKMQLPDLSSDGYHFLISPNGYPLSICTARQWFLKLLKRCGIPYVGGNHGPRVHDLRHTFASHSLMHQVREGADIYCVLPILATYLGHKTLFGTERYVRLTHEMYPDVVKMEESISSFVFPSMSLMMRADEKK